MIKELAFSQYDSVVKISATLPQYDSRHNVTRVGTKIQEAVKLYAENKLSKS